MNKYKYGYNYGKQVLLTREEKIWGILVIVILLLAFYFNQPG